MKTLLQHRFGLNYVPSRNWYFCYNDWNSGDIRRDLDAVAALGADHIRVMVIWPWFQPNPAYVSVRHLDRLEEMLDIARERHLDVLVTLFTGWLSGFHFNPPYLENEPFYTSPEWAKVQDLFLDEAARRLQTHENFMGFDIGNEINCNWQAAPAQGDAWMERVLERMQSLCPGRVHVNGVDHQPWFGVNTFSPQALMGLQPIVALHAWPFWCGAGRYGSSLEDPYTRLAAGMAALARSYGNDPAKPIWIEEFGACSEEMPAREIPAWLEKTVMTAIGQGVSWFTWWASHDVDPRYQFHPFEYQLGLLTLDNQVKPQGQVFKQIAQAFQGKPVSIPTNPLPPPPEQPDETSTWRWLLDWMG
ncbi:MAG: cellulase family glycosylhydrolase [Anaerolineales bacterium]